MKLNYPISSIYRARRIGMVVASFAVACVAGAVERKLSIEAPRMVKAGVEARIAIHAGTDAGDKEHVGFLHVEVSTDEGKTWVALCYLDNGGAKESRRAILPAGQAGGTMIVRARAAFRGGQAGDVDYRGGRIQWEGTWDKWSEPPARHLTISVR
jgi:hypothetical protein